jgi:hypothetical protein
MLDLDCELISGENCSNKIDFVAMNMNEFTIDYQTDITHLNTQSRMPSVSTYCLVAALSQWVIEIWVCLALAKSQQCKWGLMMVMAVMWQR